MSKNQQAKTFDPKQLDSMLEPLSVRVEKIKGGQRTSIPLPSHQDGSDGELNWSRDSIRGIEGWLVRDVAGGGKYVITVSDSSQPPQVHTWENWFDPAMFPERIPETLTEAMASPSVAPRPPQVAQPAYVGGGFMTPRPRPYQPPVLLGGPPTGPQMYYQTPAGTAVAGGPAWQQPAWWEQPAQPPPQQPPQVSQVEQMRQQLDAERRAREEEQRKREAQEQQARFSAQLEGERREHREAMKRLEDQLAALADSRANKPDPQLEALRLQMEQQKRELDESRRREDDARREREQERREREAEVRFQAQQAEQRRQNEETNRRIETMQQQMQQQLAAAQQNRHDPMIAVMQENQRQQIEAMKELARSQAAQMTEFKALVMHPRDMMAMIKDASGGADQLARQVTSMYQDVAKFQQDAFRQAMEMTQQGGGTAEVIERSIERAAGFAERYITAKSKEANVQVQSQAEIASAQAQAMTAQAEALKAQATMQQARGPQQAQVANAQQQPNNVVPLPVQSNGHTNGHANGTNGASVPMMITNEMRAKLQALGATDAQIAQLTPQRAHEIIADAERRLAANQQAVQQQRQASQGVKRNGQTDDEWFGPILLPEVYNLRAGVARFLESIKQKPARLNKDGSIDGIDPSQTAAAMIEALEKIEAANVDVPAVKIFLYDDSRTVSSRVSDFLEILLPDAPGTYREDVAKILVEAMEGDGDDDDDDDDDKPEQQATAS